MKRRTLLQLGATLPLLACSTASNDPLVATMEKIRPLFRRKSRPQAGDWLAEHKEPGQTYPAGPIAALGAGTARVQVW